MGDFLQPLRLVDVAIAWLLLEGALVSLRHFRRNEAPAALWALANAAAGLMLLLTVRAALTGAGGFWLVLGLTGALVAHLGELASRRKILGMASGRATGPARPGR